MKKQIIVIGTCLLALALLGAGCVAPERDSGQVEGVATARATSTPEETDRVDRDLSVGPSATPTAAQGDARLRVRGTPEPRQLPERVPPLKETAFTGEVPEELMRDIVDDLVERTGADRATIEVLRAEAVVWNDGSLGCPQPGVMYTQALVAGYWVELNCDGKPFDYRASESGFFFLCEQSLQPGAGTAPDQ